MPESRKIQELMYESTKTLSRFKNLRLDPGMQACMSVCMNGDVKKMTEGFWLAVVNIHNDQEILTCPKP